jgi:hypothetical protein
MSRTYAELSSLETFEDRYNYLKLTGDVGKETFGFDRYLNQMFYTSRPWRRIRSQVIVRDSGCDLGIIDREIFSGLYIHHMNPITISDIKDGNEMHLLNPDFLITTTHGTHNSIHYGSTQVPQLVVSRKPNDTKLW